MVVSAARIAPVPRDAWTDEMLAVFEIVEGPKAREQGSRSNVILTLANHPALASRFLAFSHYLQRQSTLPPRLRELVILRVAWRHRCEYERRHHLNLAGYFGVTPAECAAVEGGDLDAAGWSELERLALHAVDQLCAQSRIEPATWAALAALGDKQLLLDLVFTVGGYTTLAWALNTLEVEVDDELSRGLSPTWI
jgi:alkylhydroperoxidase family enzyme